MIVGYSCECPVQFTFCVYPVFVSFLCYSFVPANCVHSSPATFSTFLFILLLARIHENNGDLLIYKENLL